MSMILGDIGSVNARGVAAFIVMSILLTVLYVVAKLSDRDDTSVDNGRGYKSTPAEATSSVRSAEEVYGSDAVSEVSGE